MDFLHLKTFKGFCNYFGYDSPKLAYQLYVLNRNKFYDIFDIEKSSGGVRTINSPIGVIRSLQRKLLLEFSAIYKPTTIAKGFFKGSSIVDNSRIHTSRKWIVNIDIEDFFNTITFPRIYGMLQKKPFSFNKKISGLIANIATFKGSLPQGSPLSPVISNMISFKLDRRLSAYTKGTTINVTRYADDITFSSDDYDELPKIYFSDKISKLLLEVFTRNGFSLNVSKTRLRHYYNHQEVTGIVVNEKQNIKKFMKYRIRSLLHALEKYGEIEVYNEYMRRNNLEPQVPIGNDVRQLLEGLLAYVKMVLGSDSLFFKKSAIRYNKIIQENKIITITTVQEALEKAVFVIESGPSQGTCFVDRKSNIYTCLHNVVDIECLVGFPDEEVRKSYLINEIKRKNTKIFNKEIEFNLDDVKIISYSVDEDLLVFGANNFYHPYYILVDSSNIDRRFKYTVIGYPDSESELPEILDESAKFLKPRNHKGILMHPINSKVVQGMSGAPVLKANSNIAVGFVTYGDESTYEISEASNVKNRVMTFFQSDILTT